MELMRQLEALLFSSGKAMEEEKLLALTGSDTRKLRAALKALQREYDDRGSALKLYNEGTQWKMLVRDEHIDLVRRIVADTELTKATLETLAIIAYHQPKVLQSKVVELRGGNAYEQITELQELGFITKTKEGRSFSLKVTDKFYDYFDVEGQESIRKVFKDANLPEPKELQKQLGDLKVVDLPAQEEKAERKKATVGDLEIVDELAESEKAEDDGRIEAPAKLDVTEEDKQQRSDFLSKIESQIDALSRRNNEREEDADFKPTRTETPAAEDQDPTDDETPKDDAA